MKQTAKTWKHPTGRVPSTVDIISLGPSQREYHAHQHSAYTPSTPAPDEVWTLNKGIRTVKSDLAFVLDDLEGERRKSARYADEIIAYAQERNVITSELASVERPTWPGLFHDYPLTRILDKLGGEIAYRRYLRRRNVNPNAPLPTAHEARQAGLDVVYYLHNSIPMILAYALFIGVHEIRLYGADYNVRRADHLEANRPNCEYWVGFLRALGVRVMVPTTTTLLNTDEQPYIYGYARAPVLGPLPEHAERPVIPQPQPIVRGVRSE